MSTSQNKQAERIYDRFRSSDEQINFLMSEKGEMFLDRQIVKMMKDMDADEIIQFANQFFKLKQNQCSSLQMLINTELSMREEQGGVEKSDEHDVNNIGLFEAVNNNSNDNITQRTVSNLDNLPNIMKELSNIKEILQETNNNTQQQQSQLHNNDDTIHFQQYTYDEYIPKLSPDQEYLISTQNDDQYLQFDRLPSYLLLEAAQNQKLMETNNKQVKSQTQSKSYHAKTTIKQQKSAKIDTQTTKKQEKILFNQPKQKHNQPEEIYQNQQQIQSQIPTTVQQDQQQDFEQLSRTHLQDNKYKITYNNGDQYQGELENQMKNGWGDYHYNTGERYQGFFVDDQIHGYGEYFFLSGALYEGDWSSGMKHGIGMLKFSNGDVYQGQFVRDHFHGKGTYNYANGDVFTGIWKNGQRHGKGKLQTFDGSLQIGNWVFDKFQI